MLNEQVENVMAIAFELARIREEHGAQSGMYLSEVRALRAEVERLAAQSAPLAQQAREYPPLPEGVKARFKCEDCDGTGYTGEMIPGSEFQPPEPVGCTSCNFTGWWAEGEAYSADQMHAYLDSGRSLAVETARMLAVELASERETTANLTRALRDAIEPPIFMGEPVIPPKPVGFVVLDHFGPNKHFFSSFYETRNTEREWVPVYAGRAIPATSKTDGGMVLRDHFAARAMAALLTRVDVVAGDYVTNATPDDAATSAYRYADAMLRAKE